MYYENRGKIKYHGCSCPFSVAQISIITLYFINIALFSIFWIPAFAFSTALLVIGIVFFYLLNIAEGVIYIIACATKTTDPQLYAKRRSERNNENKNKSISIKMDDSKFKFCKKCNSYCSINSYHCNHCNRCTLNYNHHWFLINNCVSSRNYSLFIVLLILGLLSSAFQIAMMIVFYGCVKYFVTKNLINAYRNDITILSSFFIAFIVLTNALLLIYFFSKLLYHIFLGCKGIPSHHYEMRYIDTKKQIKAV